MTPDVLMPPVPAWATTTDRLTQVLEGLSAAHTTLVLPAPGDPEALMAAGCDPADIALVHEPATTAGAVTVVPLDPSRSPVRRVVLVGTGPGRPADWRAAGAAVGRSVRRPGTVVLGGVAEDENLVPYVEAAVLAGAPGHRWTSSRADDELPSAVLVLTERSEEVRRAVARSRATLVARALANTPSNIKSPAWLAGQARTHARRGGCAVEVRDERALRRDGFGAILAVGAASATPPRLVRLEHAPDGAAGHPHVVLVGKGITFDSGGLDRKPAEGMLPMKTDMSGAAIVLAVLGACRELAVPVRVTGLLPLAENAIGGAAMRPSDVLTQYGGRRVEIGNTDAEGRLVLADALAYAVAELAPDVVVDVATLTGAARVALGRAYAPVFATDDLLRDALVAAGDRVGELLWPMPLHAAYRPLLDSTVADLAHVDHTGRGGGAVTAALFLREFVGDVPWAHLDIAGVGRSDADTGIFAKGGTGFGVRLLLNWLEGL